jgi:hypothetical protein
VGVATTLSVTRSLVASPGTVAITGQSTTLNRTYDLVASPATVPIAGQSISLQLTRQIVASPATVPIVGQSTTLSRTVTLTASPATVPITGQSTALHKTAHIVVTPATVPIAGVGVDLSYITGTYQYLRPNADDSAGAWTTETGATTNLYQSIDETSANDSDYIRSPVNPTQSACKFALPGPSVPPKRPFTIRYRYEKDQPTGTMSLRARLLCGTTVIATWTESNISDTWTTTEHSLTSGEFAAITDFNDLHIELMANP